MMKNELKVKRIQTGTQTIFRIKNGMVYNLHGRNVYCSCTGNTVETATPMEFANGEVFCPHCHEKKVEVLQTYEQWKAEKDAEEKRRNEEKLATLHLVERGSDWECGFKFYGLSANIDYDDWLKVKEHFRYYKRGWSRGQELEWNYGEPSGWLTRNPQSVENILVDIGLIKPENTMESISERKMKEEEKRRIEREKRVQKKTEIRAKLHEIDEKINEAFNSPDRRTLSDAEANENYFNPTFGKGTVVTFTIRNGEIIKCGNMGDFKYGVAIPYKEYVEQLIDNFYYFEKQLQNL